MSVYLSTLSFSIISFHKLYWTIIQYHCCQYGRAGSTVLTNYNSDGEKMTILLRTYPLYTESALTHYLGVVEPVYSKFTDNGSVSTSGHTTEGSTASSLASPRLTNFQVSYIKINEISIEMMMFSLSYSNECETSFLMIILLIYFRFDVIITFLWCLFEYLQSNSEH